MVNITVVKNLPFLHGPSGFKHFQTYHWLAIGSLMILMQIGIFVKQIGYDERRKRLRFFRDGHITLMVGVAQLGHNVEHSGRSKI